MWVLYFKTQLIFPFISYISCLTPCRKLSSFRLLLVCALQQRFWFQNQRRNQCLQLLPKILFQLKQMADNSAMVVRTFPFSLTWSIVSCNVGHFISGFGISYYGLGGIFIFFITHYTPLQFFSLINPILTIRRWNVSIKITFGIKH